MLYYLLVVSSAKCEFDWPLGIPWLQGKGWTTAVQWVTLKKNCVILFSIVGVVRVVDHSFGGLIGMDGALNTL